MQGIGAAAIITIILIVILELFRFFRVLTNLSRDIDELKEKVSNIEEVLSNKK